MISSRRGLLLGAAAVVAGPALQGAAAPEDFGAETIALWPGTPPGGGGPGRHALRISRHGLVRGVSCPCLTVFRPAQATGTACLIAPGGGYRVIDEQHEGFAAARWCAARGITAFVLRYRLPREGWTAGDLAPEHDVWRALRLIRALPEVAPDRILLMGFSAGGHLAGLIATSDPAAADYPHVDAADDASVRVAALALAYPVISLLPPDDHSESARVLLGGLPSPDLAARLSLQNRITPAAPPVFLVDAADDPIAPPGPGTLLGAACMAAGVAFERLLLPSGGHGFAMGRAGTPSAGWPGTLAGWLGRQGFV